MNTRILQSTPAPAGGWGVGGGRWLSLLSPVMEQDIYDVGKPVVDLKKTDNSQEWVWAVEKTWDREGARKCKKAIPVGSKVSG